MPLTPRKLALSTLCSLSLLLSLPAHAALETPIKALPGKPDTVMVVQTDPAAWKYFAGRKPFNNLKNHPTFKELFSELVKQGVDLDKDVFANLGSHIAAAFYFGDRPDDAPAIFALSMKSAEAAKSLQAKLLAASKDELKSKKPIGDSTLYMLQGKDAKNSFAMLQQGETLILGSSAKQDRLKLLETPGSGALLKDETFKEVAEQLKDDKVWVYSDQQGFKQMLKLFDSKAEDETGLDQTDEKTRKRALAKADKEFEELSKLTRGLGLGFDPSREGLAMRAYLPVNTGIGEIKNYLELMQPNQKGVDIKGIWPYMPAKPLVALAGQNLDVALEHPMPKFAGQDMRELQGEFDKMVPELLAGFTKASGLDFKQDVQAYLDGRYALSVEVPGLSDGGLMSVMMPSSIDGYGTLLLGIRASSRQAFFENFERKLKVDLAAFDDPQAEKQAAVLDNLTTLKGMLGNYGKRHGQHYPAKVAQLVQDAKLGKYEETLVNPLTGKSGVGLGLGLLDYSTYQASKPQTSFAGTVFYAPYGKADAKGLYPGYQLYGYAPNGSMWNAAYNKDASQIGSTLPKVEIPVKPRLVPFDKETYKGTTLHVANLAKADKDWSMENIQPSWAQVGDFLALGLNPASLKATLDAGKKPASGGQFAELLKNQAASQKNALLYLDLNQFKTLLEQASASQDAGEAADNFIKALKYLYADQGLTPKGWKGGIMLGLDMDKIDFEQLLDAIKPDAAAPPALNEKPAVSSSLDSAIKANMHTLQTMVETYAVDWGGVYAADLKGLKAEAQSASAGKYWKELTNPVSGKNGIGAQGALLDLKDYKPNSALAGAVVYEPIKQKNAPIVLYYIYGIGKDGKFITETYKGKTQPFYLTNS